jgi:phosphoglucosamine mutase
MKTSATPLFGTDGIRGPVGTYPFTHQGIQRIAAGLATWMLQQSLNQPVLIARDTRPSGPMIADWIHDTLHTYNIPTLDAGVLPTPAVVLLPDYYDYHYAIVVSASHNKAHDNGIKIIHARQGKLPPDHEAAIQRAIDLLDIAPANIKLPTQNLRTTINAHQTYISCLQTRYHLPDLTGKKLVLDGAHGASSMLAYQLLSSAGAQIIHLDYPIDGARINDMCGATNPAGLQQTVIQHCAYLGIAFDGDGDRLILVDAHGHIRHGDDILALLLHHPLYRNTPAVIGTIMSNQGLQQAVLSLGKQFIRTPVGDAHVAAALPAHQALLGGEPSGHIMVSNGGPTGDALIALIQVLTTLDHLQGQWPPFHRYPHEIQSLSGVHIIDLDQEPYASIIHEAQNHIPGGRLVIRYSGTEKNTLRIMIEANTQTDILACQKYLHHHLLPYIS